MKLCDIMAGVLEAGLCPDIEINKIAYDSRKVESGDIFVCIKGYQTDGHKYVSSAVEKGAAAVVAMDKTECSVPVIYVSDSREALALMSKNYYKNPIENKTLIGITGTNGKTTVTYLIKTICEQQGRIFGLIGTNQNVIGDEIIPAERTTPESNELYGLFDRMIKKGADGVVMEVCSHALELHRVGGCEFEVAVFTNLTQDHLDFHGDMENYFLAKKKLFSMCKNAVVNIDDEYGKRIMPDCNFYSYGIENSKAKLNGKNVKISASGVDFDLEYEGRMYPVHLCIPGKFSVYNALAALGAAIASGISPEDAAAGLVKAEGVKGRAEVVPTDTDFTVIIDYAHTPDGLENIISTVNEFKKGRVITLFGCGGDRDKTKRPVMGKCAGSLSDFVVVTSDNPRSEDPSAIIDDIMPGVIESGCEYVRIENRKDAITWALENAKKDDIIVLAGKGHETYQILNTGTIHFDEREIVSEVLSAKR